jgi:hypothetical protein
MKNKSIKSLVIVIAILALAITIAGCSSSKNIAAGSTWEVAKTTDLSDLTIADGAAIKAPEGYSVTMTVNSIGTAINPGTYKGKIVLTVTEEIKIGGMPGGGMPAGGPPDAWPRGWRFARWRGWWHARRTGRWRISPFQGGCLRRKRQIYSGKICRSISGRRQGDRHCC